MQPFRGTIANDSNNGYCPPRHKFYLNINHIFWEGVYANIIQHAGGNAIFFWHEDQAGYEFFMFDYGPGALNVMNTPQENLEKIFDKYSYRQGGLGPDGLYHGGGKGVGLWYVGYETYLTRVVSVNAGQVRVIDKTPGFNQCWVKHVSTIQETFTLNALQIENIAATGFMVHGFVPFFVLSYYGTFSPISSSDILGSIITSSARFLPRGPWQLPPAGGLNVLTPGQTVSFTYYQVEEEHQHTGILREVPSPQNEGVFVFADGFEIESSSVKFFSVPSPILQ